MIASAAIVPHMGEGPSWAYVLMEYNMPYAISNIDEQRGNNDIPATKITYRHVAILTASDCGWLHIHSTMAGISTTPAMAMNLECPRITPRIASCMLSITNPLL